MEKVLVTGSSGFIGSHLVDTLLERGHSVIGFDNMSTGVGSFMSGALGHKEFTFIQGDILNLEALRTAVHDVDVVYHLAANADIRGGIENTRRDLEQNTIGTYNVLESMRLSNRARRICFASSAAAIGEPREFPTPEHLACPSQTSLYGASKMAGEGLISAFANAFGIEAYCFRFVSLLGPRYPHGHVYDFVRKLKENPGRLEILGDGTAKKSYLHIFDCISALMMVVQDIRPAEEAQHPFAVYNLGLDESIEVRESARLISAALDLKPLHIYGKGQRGWIGDNPIVLLDTAKIRSLGWKPVHSIEESITQTAQWLADNEWLFKERI